MMEKKNLEDSLKEAFASSQQYFNMQLKYNRLLLSKRLGEVSAVFALFMILLILFSFALFFLSFWFVDWFAENIGSRYYGNLIVFGFYLLLGLLLLFLREPLIFSPIRSMFTKAFAGGDFDAEERNQMNSRVAIDRKLINFRESVRKEEELLKEKLEDLGEAFTFQNIIQSAGKSFYQSFVTTSNIARMSYLLVKKLKGSRKGKKRKKLKDAEE